MHKNMHFTPLLLWIVNHVIFGSTRRVHLMYIHLFNMISMHVSRDILFWLWVSFTFCCSCSLSCHVDIFYNNNRKTTNNATPTSLTQKNSWKSGPILATFCRFFFIPIHYHVIFIRKSALIFISRKTFDKSFLVFGRLVFWLVRYNMTWHHTIIIPFFHPIIFLMANENAMNVCNFL